MRAHANAAAGGGAGGAGVLLVWLLNRYADAGLSAEDGALISAAAATVVLLVGRRGLRGLARLVWRGGGEG